MYKFFFIVGAVVVLFISYYAITLYLSIQVSKKLVERAVPYELLSDDHAVTVLVLGDSTAVGVGATHAENTVAGRVAQYVHATYVENRAVSGAVVSDIATQIAHAKLSAYTYVVLQIGANDIIRFHTAEESGETLALALKKLPHADTVLVLTAGNVGGTSFFPWFMRPFYTMRTLQYHEIFTKVVTHAGYTYINLYTEPARDPFVLQKEKYIAEDGLHLTDEGYGLWFESIKKHLIE